VVPEIGVANRDYHYLSHPEIASDERIYEPLSERGNQVTRSGAWFFEFAYTCATHSPGPSYSIADVHTKGITNC
jgi:hypothetical protein